MVSVNESKSFCLYCRGEIDQKQDGTSTGQLQQYHQQCFEEMIKDNHCEYCLNILNELNNFFTEKEVKIHQKCVIELERIITEKISPIVTNYLKMIPLKKLAKEYAFYEMKEDKLSFYIEDLQKDIVSQLPDVSDKSENFQLFVDKKATEVVKKLISNYTKNELQVKLNSELVKCRPDSKKDIVDKTLHFIWMHYLEIPTAYKDRLNHKVLPKPVLDSVNYTIFHFILEKLFNTALDFNSVVNSNYNELSDYLLGQPISIHQIKI